MPLPPVSGSDPTDPLVAASQAVDAQNNPSITILDFLDSVGTARTDLEKELNDISAASPTYSDPLYKILLEAYKDPSGALFKQVNAFFNSLRSQLIFLSNYTQNLNEPDLASNSIVLPPSFSGRTPPSFLSTSATGDQSGAGSSDALIVNSVGLSSRSLQRLLSTTLYTEIAKQSEFPVSATTLDKLNLLAFNDIDKAAKDSAQPTINQVSEKNVASGNASSAVDVASASSFADNILNNQDYESNVRGILESDPNFSKLTDDQKNTVVKEFAAAYKIALLHVALSQISQALGLPGLNSQVLGNVSGNAQPPSPESADVNSTLDDPLSVAYLKVSVAIELLQNQTGLPPEAPDTTGTPPASTSAETPAAPPAGSEAGATATTPSGTVASAPPSGAATSAAPSGAATSAPSSGAATSAPPSGAATSAAPTGAAPSAAPSGTATSAPPSGTATSAAPSGAAPSATPSGAATSAAPSGAAVSAPPSISVPSTSVSAGVSSTAPTVTAPPSGAPVPATSPSPTLVAAAPTATPEQIKQVETIVNSAVNAVLSKLTYKSYKELETALSNEFQKQGLSKDLSDQLAHGATEILKSENALPPLDTLLNKDKLNAVVAVVNDNSPPDQAPAASPSAPLVSDQPAPVPPPTVPAPETPNPSPSEVAAAENPPPPPPPTPEPSPPPSSDTVSGSGAEPSPTTPPSPTPTTPPAAVVQQRLLDQLNDEIHNDPSLQPALQQGLTSQSATTLRELRNNVYDHLIAAHVSADEANRVTNLVVRLVSTNALEATTTEEEGLLTAAEPIRNLALPKLAESLADFINRKFQSILDNTRATSLRNKVLKTLLGANSIMSQYGEQLRILREKFRQEYVENTVQANQRSKAYDAALAQVQPTLTRASLPLFAIRQLVSEVVNSEITRYMDPVAQDTLARSSPTREPTNFKRNLDIRI